MSSPTALVTGATGFIGSHLVERLIAAGYRVRCLVRPSSSLSHLKVLPVELCFGDLVRDAGLEAAVAGADIVFHVAGVTKALAPADYYTGNVTATEHLLEACARYGKPGAGLIYVSSLAASGPAPSAKAISEDVACAPITHYGASKLEGEVRLRHSPLAPRTVIVRPPVVYGPRDTDVLAFLWMASHGWLPAIGGQDAYFSLIHARDLADGMIAAAASDAAFGRTYFLSNPEPISWSEFGALAAAIACRKPRSLPVPVPIARLAGFAAEVRSRLSKKPGILSREKIREARCRYWVCDPSRAHSDFGFTSKIPVRDGVAETLAWYREAGWLRY